jgi:peptide/nickel transport system ATP-binding protein
LHPYTHALLAATSDPDARNADSFKEVPPGEPPSLVNPPTGCRFHPRCPHFMAGLCDVKFPPDFEPEPGHFVACWLYEEPETLDAFRSANGNEPTQQEE